jgi:hypothetical protein
MVERLMAGARVLPLSLLSVGACQHFFYAQGHSVLRANEPLPGTMIQVYAARYQSCLPHLAMATSRRADLLQSQHLKL